MFRYLRVNVLVDLARLWLLGQTYDAQASYVHCVKPECSGKRQLFKNEDDEHNFILYGLAISIRLPIVETRGSYQSERFV